MTRVEPWLFRLDAAASRLAGLSALLDADERAQAAAFRHDLHRRRFVARRGLLRELLAARTGRPPDALRLVRSPFGKPALAGEGLRFNASSAGPLGLCVLAVGAEVGCDLAEGDAAAAGLASLFGPAEQRAIAALPVARRTRAELAVWTRKEAYLKALGIGLQGALDAFDVPVGDDVGEHDLGDGWTLATLPVPTPFLAALVVRAAPGELDVAAVGTWPVGDRQAGPAA